MIDAALAACAPAVSPVTLAAIIRVESAGQPLAININKGPRVALHRDAASAARTARVWISRGHTVDLGLMQVNSSNLARLGYTVEQMFDPCTNIRAGAAILANNYTAAARRRGEGQTALRDALSAYNTGSFVRGYNNGYVGKYFNLRGANIPIGSYVPADLPKSADPYSADTSVFSRKETENAAIGPGVGDPTQPALFD